MRRAATPAVLVAAVAIACSGGPGARPLEGQDRREEIERLNGEGLRHFRAGRYREALESFEQALAGLPEGRITFRFDVLLSIAGTRIVLGDLLEAKAILERLMRDDPDRAERYRRELAVVLRKLRGLPPASGTDPVPLSGDDRLVKLARSILPSFPGVRLPLVVTLLPDEENTPAGLRRLGLATHGVPVAQGSTVDGRHLVLLNASFWRDASDAAFKGAIAHELMHFEWSDLGLDEALFAWTRDSLAYASLEHVIDYLVVGKGLAEPLYSAKVYMLARAGDDYLRDDISPNAHHLADVISRASRFEMVGRGDRIPKAPVPAGIAEDVKKRLEAFSWHRR